MKPIHLTNLGQKGSTLLEALVALLLTSIIALGGALSIGKILKTQRQSNIQQAAVDQLRVLLQSGSNLCGTTPQITVNNENLNSVHDKFHRTLILSGFCFLKIAKISLNSSFFPKPIKR